VGRIPLRTRGRDDGVAGSGMKRVNSSVVLSDAFGGVLAAAQEKPAAFTKKALKNLIPL